MNKLYALVKNNTIERINIQLPIVLDETYIPQGAENLQQYCLYEIQGQEPAYNPQRQRLAGPSYAFDGTAVNRIYTIEDIDLDEIRNQIWESIKQERDRRTHTGGYKVDTKWYHSDTFSRSQQLGLVLLKEAIPAGLMWKTMDGSFIEMTPMLAQDIFQSAVLSDNILFAYAENLNQQVKSSTNPADINIYSGWPACYFDLT